MRPQDIEARRAQDPALQVRPDEQYKNEEIVMIFKEEQEIQIQPS